MKTKNIFRMLLVAAALLMGANNLKADNETVWSSENGHYLGAWDGNKALILNGQLNSLKCDGKDVIRVYGRLGSELGPIEDGGKTISYGIEIMPQWNSDSNNKKKTTGGIGDTFEKGYYDFEEISSSLASALKNQCIINGYNFYVTAIVINPLSVSFSNKNVELTFGDTFTPPTVTTTPANATVIYSSSNVNVAYISNNTVIPVGAGSATITGTIQGTNVSNTYTITVNAPTREGAVWNGATWLNNFDVHPTISTSLFSSAQSGGYIRFYGKVGPLRGNYWKFEIFKDWGDNGNLFRAEYSENNDEFAKGYIDVPVNQINPSSISEIILNGNNLTITAIQVIAPNVQTYTASAASASNGTVSLSATSGITAGTTVTITATPNTGYETGSITITDANSSTVSYTSIGNNQYTFVMPASNVTVSVTFNQIEDRYFSVDMDRYIYRTFVYTDDPIDFSKAVGLEGYYAKNLNSTRDEVIFEQVTGIVAAGTPLLLKKLDNATETKLWRAKTSGTTPSPNLLIAGNGGEIQGANYYVLTYHWIEAENGFNYVFAETTYQKAQVDTDRAYLYVGGGNARGKVSIRFTKGDTNGINNIKAETLGDDFIYNLRGQRVEHPTKGLYIINGKKVMIK